MTQIQLDYWANQEKMRANKAQESLKSQDIRRETRLTNAQVEKLAAELPKLAADVENIKADTSLTENKRAELVSKTVGNYLKPFADILKVIGLAAL